MHKSFLSILTIGTVLAAQTASAFSFNPDAFLFKDISRNRAIAVSVALLAEAGVVDNRDSFRPSSAINRAEFLKMVFVASRKSPPAGQNCFTDVRSTDWFSSAVCSAKELGVVKGYTIGGKSSFKPSQTITFAEALKIANISFGLNSPPIVGRPWYDSYYQSFQDIDFKTMLLSPTIAVTRGDAARLVAYFLANDRGVMNEYKAALSGQISSSSSVSSSRSSSVSSSSSSRSSVSSSSSSSVYGGPLDPMADTRIRSQFLLLGETSPVLGAASVFIEQEPLVVKTISVDLNQASTPTISNFLIYNENKTLLGRATLDSAVSANTRYTLTLPSNSFVIPKNITTKFYVRGELASKDNGGTSGLTIAINQILVKGTGFWSTDDYNKATVANFLSFQTSRSIISSIRNAGNTTDTLIAGPQREIGRFSFEGRRSDGTAKIFLTDLVFQIESVGGVTVTNVKLAADGIPQKASCTVSGDIITCATLDASYGSLIEAPRTITLYGDVATLQNVQNASLRITLNNPGDFLNEGAITWYDGTTMFDWTQFDGPVAQGTLYRY
ncbi:MAG: S-layer homology domain-containing protein [Candidatus Peribacteraceae bacterium]|nr:S-layer homology domain-containing protein [Candidatus Peribacteraceae bacterium]